MAPKVDTVDAGSLGRTEVHSHALITAIQEIGLSLAMKGAYDAAIDTLAFAHRLRARLAGPSRDDIAKTVAALAYGYQMAGRIEEAIPHWASTLELHAEQGERHPNYLLTRSNLAASYARVGRFEEAGVAFERLMPLQNVVLGPCHPSVAQTLNNYARVFIDKGRPEEAEAERLYQRAADIRRSAFGADSPRYGSLLLGVANARRNQANWAGAAEAYAEALAILRSPVPVHQQALADYAQVLRALGRDSEAAEVERAAQASAVPGSG